MDKRELIVNNHWKFYSSFIDWFVSRHIFNTSYPYKVYITVSYHTGGLFRIKLKDIGEKSQSKNEFFLNNDIINSKWNQIIDITEEIDPLITGQLDYGTWMYCEPSIFLE